MFDSARHARWGKTIDVRQRPGDLVARFADNQSGVFIGMFNVEGRSLAGRYVVADDVTHDAVTMLLARHSWVFRHGLSPSWHCTTTRGRPYIAISTRASDVLIPLDQPRPGTPRTPGEALAERSGR